MPVTTYRDPKVVPLEPRKGVDPKLQSAKKETTEYVQPSEKYQRVIPSKPYIPSERTSTMSFKAPMSEEKRLAILAKEQAERANGGLYGALSYVTSPVRYFTSALTRSSDQNKKNDKLNIANAKKIYKTSTGQKGPHYTVPKRLLEKEPKSTPLPIPENQADIKLNEKVQDNAGKFTEKEQEAIEVSSSPKKSKYLSRDEIEAKKIEALKHIKDALVHRKQAKTEVKVEPEPVVVEQEKKLSPKVNKHIDLKIRKASSNRYAYRVSSQTAVEEKPAEPIVHAPVRDLTKPKPKPIRIVSASSRDVGKKKRNKFYHDVFDNRSAAWSKPVNVSQSADSQIHQGFKDDLIFQGKSSNSANIDHEMVSPDWTVNSQDRISHVSRSNSLDRSNSAVCSLPISESLEDLSHDTLAPCINYSWFGSSENAFNHTNNQIVCLDFNSSNTVDILNNYENTTPKSLELSNSRKPIFTQTVTSSPLPVAMAMRVERKKSQKQETVTSERILPVTSHVDKLTWGKKSNRTSKSSPNSGSSKLNSSSESPFSRAKSNKKMSPISNAGSSVVKRSTSPGRAVKADTKSSTRSRSKATAQEASIPARVSTEKEPLPVEVAAPAKTERAVTTSIKSRSRSSSTAKPPQVLKQQPTTKVVDKAKSAELTKVGNHSTSQESVKVKPPIASKDNVKEKLEITSTDNVKGKMKILTKETLKLKPAIASKDDGKGKTKSAKISSKESAKVNPEITSKNNVSVNPEIPLKDNISVKSQIDSKDNVTVKPEIPSKKFEQSPPRVLPPKREIVSNPEPKPPVSTKVDNAPVATADTPKPDNAPSKPLIASWFAAAASAVTSALTTKSSLENSADAQTLEKNDPQAQAPINPEHAHGNVNFDPVDNSEAGFNPAKNDTKEVQMDKEVKFDEAAVVTNTGMEAMDDASPKRRYNYDPDNHALAPTWIGEFP